MALAVLIGYFNGVFTWHLRLPSLLVTLGFLFVYSGLVEHVTGGFPLEIPDEHQGALFLQLLGGKLFGLSNSIYICIALVAVFAFVMAKTQHGSLDYAVGGARQAVRQAAVGRRVAWRVSPSPPV